MGKQEEVMRKERIHYFTKDGDREKRSEILTVATTIIEATGQVEYGVACCSSLDNFCKQKGREIASERLNSDVYCMHGIADVVVKNSVAIKLAILCDMVSHIKDYPQAFRSVIMDNLSSIVLDLAFDVTKAKV